MSNLALSLLHLKEHACTSCYACLRLPLLSLIFAMTSEDRCRMFVYTWAHVRSCDEFPHSKLFVDDNCHSPHAQRMTHSYCRAPLRSDVVPTVVLCGIRALERDLAYTMYTGGMRP